MLGMDVFRRSVLPVTLVRAWPGCWISVGDAASGIAGCSTVDTGPGGVCSTPNSGTTWP